MILYFFASGDSILWFVCGCRCHYLTPDYCLWFLLYRDHVTSNQHWAPCCGMRNANAIIIPAANRIEHSLCPVRSVVVVVVAHTNASESYKNVHKNYRNDNCWLPPLWQTNNIQRKLWWSHREQRTKQELTFFTLFIRAAVCFGLLLLLIGLNRCYVATVVARRPVLLFLSFGCFSSFRFLANFATEHQPPHTSHQHTMNAFSVYFFHSKLRHSNASHRWPMRDTVFCVVRSSVRLTFWLLDERTAVNRHSSQPRTRLTFGVRRMVWTMIICSASFRTQHLVNFSLCQIVCVFFVPVFGKWQTRVHNGSH